FQAVLVSSRTNRAIPSGLLPVGIRMNVTKNSGAARDVVSLKSCVLAPYPNGVAWTLTPRRALRVSVPAVLHKVLGQDWTTFSTAQVIPCCVQKLLSSP